MHYQKVLKIPESTPYLSVGFDVDADFTWISIMLPSGILIDKLFEITHPDPQSREPTISKIKGTQEMYSLESRCFLEPTRIHHISLLCLLRDKGFDCAATNPIITKNSTNMNIRKLHNDKLDSKKAAGVGLDAPLKASVAPGDATIDLRNLVRDCYYFKDLQSVTILKLHAELKVPFLTYLSVFSKVTTQTSSKLLEAYPLTADMLATPKDELVEIIRSAVRLGKTYTLAGYGAIYTATKDVAVPERALPSNTLQIGLYTKMCREYQAHLNSILEELHQAVGKLEGTPDYDRISSTQTSHGVGFLSAIALIAEMGSFDLFSSPKKLYAYFELGPGVNGSSKFRRDRVHTSKRDSNLVKCILHIVAIDNLEVGKVIRTPVSPVIYGYYIRKCASKKKSAAVGAIMHKICNIIFATPRDNKPLGLITPEEHRGCCAVEHPKSVSTAA